MVNDAALVTCHDNVAGCPAITFWGVMLKAITADEGPGFDPPEPPGPEAPTPPQPQKANNKDKRETSNNLTTNLGRFMARFTYLGTGCDVKAAAQVAEVSSCLKKVMPAINFSLKKAPAALNQGDGSLF
jgi:hypothetical protein